MSALDYSEARCLSADTPSDKSFSFFINSFFLNTHAEHTCKPRKKVPDEECWSRETVHRSNSDANADHKTSDANV